MDGRAKTGRPMKVQRFVCTSCGASHAAWKDKSRGVKTMMRRS
jgi:hypothetical protein